MRLLPRISLPVHGLAELLLGVTLTVLGLAADLGDVGMLLTFAAGFTLLGVGLGAISDLPLAVHRVLDRGLVVVFGALAVVSAGAGNAAAAVILLASAGMLLALEAGTRWTRPAR